MDGSQRRPQTVSYCTVEVKTLRCKLGSLSCGGDRDALRCHRGTASYVVSYFWCGLEVNAVQCKL
eukprot:3802871-Pyramimonas_sp.AAC.1